MQHRLLRSFLANLIFPLAALVFHVSIGLAEEQKLILGSTANLGVLPLVAKHDSIFVKNGIEVDYRKFQTGKMTMDALISGDIEIGTIVDSNVAFIGYSKNPIKVIASLAIKLDDAIWYRSDKQITRPIDLIGKRIGYTPATTSHIFLARFLEANNISWSQITPVVLQPPAMEGALRNEHVDAV
jgi:NitT/TauT family transport system substrate-binding protein